jgi:uncharacterized protein
MIPGRSPTHKNFYMQKTCTLITGSGDGLGRSFALNCAGRGHHLVLISLPGSNLERLSAIIQNHCHVEVYWLEIDLCKADSIDKVLEFLEENNLLINMLINNAGLGHNNHFEALTTEFISREICLNIQVLTHLTHRLIPILKQSTPAFIINISSMASYFTMPKKNIYAASKAYVKQLSLSLNIELKASQIKVSTVCPSSINSNIYQYMLYRNSSWLGRLSFMYPDEVADYTLEKSLQGETLIIPGLINQIFRYLDWLLPASIKNYLLIRFVNRKGKHPSITMT